MSVTDKPDQFKFFVKVCPTGYDKCSTCICNPTGYMCNWEAFRAGALYQPINDLKTDNIVFGRAE
jgi:hypothetical protein